MCFIEIMNMSSITIFKKLLKHDQLNYFHYKTLTTILIYSILVILEVLNQKASHRTMKNNIFTGTSSVLSCFYYKTYFSLENGLKIHCMDRITLKRTLKVSWSKSLGVINQVRSMDKVNVKLFSVQSDSVVITSALSCENTGGFLSSHLFKNSLIFSLFPGPTVGSYCSLISLSLY